MVLCQRRWMGAVDYGEFPCFERKSIWNRKVPVLDAVKHVGPCGSEVQSSVAPDAHFRTFACVAPEVRDRARWPPGLRSRTIDESPPIPSNRGLYRAFQALVPEEAPENGPGSGRPQQRGRLALAGLPS